MMRMERDSVLPTAAIVTEGEIRWWEVERGGGRVRFAGRCRTGEFDSERFGCGWHVTTRDPTIGCEERVRLGTIIQDYKEQQTANNSELG